MVNAWVQEYDSIAPSNPDLADYVAMGRQAIARKGNRASSLQLTRPPSFIEYYPVNRLSAISLIQREIFALAS